MLLSEQTYGHQYFYDIVGHLLSQIPVKVQYSEYNVSFKIFLSKKYKIQIKSNKIKANRIKANRMCQL